MCDLCMHEIDRVLWDEQVFECLKKSKRRSFKIKMSSKNISKVCQTTNFSFF